MIAHLYEVEKEGRRNGWRGEELRLHLTFHGIQSEVSRLAEADFDRLEVIGNADAEVVQTILDHWCASNWQLGSAWWRMSAHACASA